jgi:tetratricopeptide (TPR) repeat protein
MRRGPRRSETEREFEDRLKAEEQAVLQLEKLVQDRKNEYTVRSRSMSGDPLGRAQLALSQGLARLALDDVLLQSPVQSFGGEGARLQLELLLQFGRAEVVREMLDDQEMRDSKEKLDLSRVPAPARPGYLPSYRLAAYEWLRFLQAAATGDYDPAAEALEQVIQPLAENGLRSLCELRRAIPLALGTELGLAAGPEHVFLCHVMFRERGQLAQLLSEVLFIAAQRADLHVLGALLAAERGRPADALKSLDKALAAAADRGPPADFAAEPLAAAYRRRLVRPHGCGRETNPVIRKGTPARPD